MEEFDKLYSSLFDNAEIYVEIIRTIARHRDGLPQEELFRIMQVKGGSLIEKLRELENAGFIMNFCPYQHKKKGIYYKVIDEFTLFYLYWIEPIKNTLLKKGLREGYWDKMMSSNSWHSWAGYAFEAICYKHLNQISKALNLSPTAIPYTWKYQSKKGSEEQGAQIDLLFDRDDESISLCEIKYTQHPFSIDKDYAAQLKRKSEVFQEKTKTKKQLFLSMISANGLKKTMYSEELVEGVVTLADLFKS